MCEEGQERRSAATEEMGVGVVGGGATGGLQAGERELGRRRRGGARTTRSVCSMIADEPRRSPSMVRCVARGHSFLEKNGFKNLYYNTKLAEARYDAPRCGGFVLGSCQVSPHRCCNRPHFCLLINESSGGCRFPRTLHGLANDPSLSFLRSPPSALHLPTFPS